MRYKEFFDSLMAGDRIRVYEANLDELNECAEKIAAEITHEDNLGEEYNIIVYIDFEERNEDALAKESVASLVIEENLFFRLYELGRRPRGAMILFGENFTRGAEYGNGTDAVNNIAAALWEIMPLPSLPKAREILKEKQEAYRQNLNAGEGILEQYKEKAIEELTENEEEGTLLKSEHPYVYETLRVFAETALKNEDLDSLDLYGTLLQDLENQRVHVQTQVTDDRVKYAHVRLKDSDFNAQSKSTIRIVLFVYACAAEETFRLIEDIDNGNENNVLGSDTIPEINWDFFASEMRERKQILEDELNEIEPIAEQFPAFDKASVAAGINLNNSRTPELTVSVRVRNRMTMAKLEKAVNDTMEEIEEKSNENDDRIKKHITMLTAEFNKDKDTLMGNMKYKSSETIENDQLTEDYLQREIDTTDGIIAAHSRLSGESGFVADLIVEARKKTSYCFDCVRRGWLVLWFGVLFTLLFAIPYALIEKSIFQTKRGRITYVVIIAGVIFVYFLAYMLFKHRFKRKILRVLNRLAESFSDTQKEKKQCLENYVQLIKKDIPIAFCLKRYKNEFDAYVCKKNVIPNYVTYHKRALEEYIQFVNNVIIDTDIKGKGTGSYSAMSGGIGSHIVLEKNKYENNSVYVFLSERNIDSYFT